MRSMLGRISGFGVNRGGGQLGLGVESELGLEEGLRGNSICVGDK